MSTWVPQLILLTMLGALLGAPSLAGADLVRRPVAVPTVGLLMLAGLCSPPLAGLALLDWSDLPPDRWEAGPIAVIDAVYAIALTGWVCAVAAVALAFSRGVRPGGPARWSRVRLAFAAVAAVSGPLGVCAGGWDAWATGPVSVASVFVAVGFARQGSERLDRGASVALGLVWIAALAWLALRATNQIENTHGFRLDGYNRRIGALPVLWIVGWCSVAVARLPSPRALVPTVPAIVVAGICGLNLVTAPNPAVSPPGSVPLLVDLAHNSWPYVGSPVPPCCVGNMDGTTVGDCMATFRTQHPQGGIIPTRLPPDLPLSEARVYPSWVAVRTDRMFPEGVRFHRLDVGHGGGSQGHLVQFVEREGLALVLLNGRPAVNGGTPMPLGSDLASQLRTAIDQVRSVSGTWQVRVEVDPSPRWTVQDMVSMCAGQGAGSGMDCGFSR